MKVIAVNCINRRLMTGRLELSNWPPDKKKNIKTSASDDMLASVSVAFIAFLLLFLDELINYL
jgi:hypothetical protein